MSKSYDIRTMRLISWTVGEDKSGEIYRLDVIHY